MCKDSDSKATGGALANLLAKCTKSTTTTSGQEKLKEKEKLAKIVPQKQQLAAERGSGHQWDLQVKQHKLQKEQQQDMQQEEQQQQQHNQRRQQGHQIEQTAMETNEETAHEQATNLATDKPTESKCKDKHKHQKQQQQHVLVFVLVLLLVVLLPTGTAASMMTPSARISSAKGTARELLFTEMAGSGGAQGGVSGGGAGGGAAATTGGGGGGAAGIECPSFDNTACPCYKFEDGKCQRTAERTN